MSGRSLDTPLGWLLLNGLTCPRDKTANCQSLMGHHVFRNRMRPRRVTGFCSFLFDYLNRSLRFCKYNFTLDGLVSMFPEISGGYFS